MTTKTTKKLITKTPYILILLILLSSTIISCKSGGEANQNTQAKSSTPKNKKLKIAVIPKGAAHEFWKSIHAGAAKASKELGIDIIWKAPSKEADREEQIKIVEDFINNSTAEDGISGIVMSPADNMALRLPVREASQSGVPVIIIDSELKSDDQISFVATDNTKGGVIAAKTLSDLVPKNGKVAMLRYQEGQESVMQREEGFMKTMAADFPNIEVVSSNQYSGLTVETAYQAAENLLNSLKGADGKLTIDGIFAPCEPVVFGMLRALEDLNLAGTVKLVGFDSSSKLVKGLEENSIDALILQDPVGMAYEGVKLMKEHLEGKSIPKLVDTGVYVVTKANMLDPKLNKLLKPEINKWLSSSRSALRPRDCVPLSLVARSPCFFNTLANKKLG